MNWTFIHGDILDIPADVLVCSANVFLNLSGGVGGAILLRYGPAMQQDLHRQLAQRQRRFADRGEVIQTPPCGTPYRAVLHAVAVDGLYESSPQIIQSVVDKALTMAAGLGARRVALTALATGYGKLTLPQFALMNGEYPPAHEVIICVRHEGDRAELLSLLSHTADTPKRSP
jgi:O-acetyl-ADP-ribose deacetylase (regulator of RNase III)